MTAIATLLRPGSQHNKRATGAVASGALYVTPEGNVAVFQGLKPAVSGDQCRYDNQEVYSITKGAIAFAEGEWVYFDGTDVARTGLIRIGKCAAAAASGDATVAVRLYPYADNARYVSVAASAAITNSSDETAFDKSVTIPANYLKAGDVIRVRLQAIATATNSTDTLTLKLKLGSTVVAATAAVDVANNDIGYMDVDIVIRTIGASGTMVAAGVQGLGVEGTVTAKPVKLASTTVDTTAALTLSVTGTWSAVSSGDSVRLDVLDVQLIRA